MNPLKPTSMSTLQLYRFKSKQIRQRENYRKRNEGAEEEHLHYQSSNEAIHLLPEETIIDILSRLPIYSLFQCALVSKAWRDIILGDPSFSSMQYKRALENQNSTLSLMFCLQNLHGTHLYFVERGGVGHCKYTIMDTQLISCSEDFFRILGSCNGLLCISFGNLVDPACVYNPITGECLMLPPSGESPHSRISGLGFDSARKEYKVVRTGKIYTIGTNAWRQLEDVPHLYRRLYPGVRFSNTFVNDSLHWLSFDGILALNMGDEKFRVVPAPRRGYCELMAWNGYLTQVVKKMDGSIDVWVMKEYNVKQSWTKKVNVKWPNLSFNPFNYWPFDVERLMDDLQFIGHPRFSGEPLYKGGGRVRIFHHVGSLIPLATLVGKEGA